eukprot:8413102-Pyramimonas_sp.AAC.1
MSPQDLARCGFIDKVGGVVFTSDAQFTCTTGTGSSHIDYLLASRSACPYVLSLTAVLAVPWGTHIGLNLKLRGEGLQLLTRSLVLPRKLPQVPRPSQTPKAGSKSQQNKRTKHERRTAFQAKFREACDRFFGDLFRAREGSQPEASQEGARGPFRMPRRQGMGRRTRPLGRRYRSDVR